jgi:hypothetical protein
MNLPSLSQLLERERNTVKASNLEPHGNFGLFLASSVASVDESCSKMTRTEFVNLKFFYYLYPLHFSVERVSMIASPSEKEVQS